MLKLKLYYNCCKHLEKLSLPINYITFAKSLVNSFRTSIKNFFAKGEDRRGNDTLS